MKWPFKTVCLVLPQDLQTINTWSDHSQTVCLVLPQDLQTKKEKHEVTFQKQFAWHFHSTYKQKMHEAIFQKKKTVCLVLPQDLQTINTRSDHSQTVCLVLPQDLQTKKEKHEVTFQKQFAWHFHRTYKQKMHEAIFQKKKTVCLVLPQDLQTINTWSDHSQTVCLVLPQDLQTKKEKHEVTFQKQFAWHFHSTYKQKMHEAIFQKKNSLPGASTGLTNNKHKE